MKIGIDIDDTLVNTREQQLIYWKDYIKKYPKDGYTEELPDKINEFGNEYIQTFWDVYRMPLSFDTTFKENTSIILHKLKKDGFTLCIVTSRPKNLTLQLKEWLKNNNIPIDIIYTDIRNKGLFCKEKKIDILIDDSLNHIKEAIKNNIKGILFNNIPEYTGIQTDNWLDLYEIIQKIKKEKNKENN